MKNGIDRAVRELIRFVKEQRKTNARLEHFIMDHERWMRSHEVRLTTHWREISRLKEKQ